MIANIAALDSFWRTRSGLGTTADRSQGATFVTQTRDESTLADWFEQDGVFAAALALDISDGLRAGFTVSSADATEADDSTRIQDMVSQWVADEAILKLLSQHMVQTRLFGGSTLFQVTNGDQSVMRSETSGPDATSRFLCFAPSELTPEGVLSQDPFDPFYGYPLRWRLAAGTASRVFDRSWARPNRTARLYTTPGRGTSSRGAYEWVGPSAAYAFMSHVQSWAVSNQAAACAIHMLSQRVLYSDRFREVRTGAEAAAAFMEQRLADINERASNSQAVVAGSDERIEVVQSPVSGMEAIIDRLMVAVAAAARKPVTRLFGVSPGGFGTGESELQMYYDEVRKWQEQDLKPVVQWMLRRKFPGADRWTVKFPPLDVPTESELLTMRAQQAQIDVGYINAAVLSPDEVATSRFGGNEFSFETTLDLEAREGAELALEAPVEDPEDPEDPDDEEDAEATDNPTDGGD